jgi:hypothetical protein
MFDHPAYDSQLLNGAFLWRLRIMDRVDRRLARVPVEVVCEVSKRGMIGKAGSLE